MPSRGRPPADVPEADRGSAVETPRCATGNIGNRVPANTSLEPTARISADAPRLRLNV